MSTARGAATATFGVLLCTYLATMAPGVTFWDAGEFITAAHGFGIPHPPGTPLYVAIGRIWILALGPLVGAARAMNALSAVSTAAACATGAWLLATATSSDGRALQKTDAWGAVAGGLCAGLAATVWSSATETEVYAVALLLVTAMLAVAWRAGLGGRGGERWTLLLAYLMALAPAMHLSALVGAPAAIVLASRGDAGRWDVRRAAMLFGVLVASAGIGRASPMLALLGLVPMLASLPFLKRSDRSAAMTRRAVALALTVLGASALAIMLVRARHDPPLNQGNPSTVAALLDVIGRRQYDVAPMWPRQAPVWLQAANVLQYADWQFGLGLGRGVFTSLRRVAVTLLFVALGVAGARRLWRENRRLAIALLVLLVSGTAGVCCYLNLKAGSSLGWGLLAPGTPHEARERDYFLVLGFWAWGLLAGYGALSAIERWRLPRPAVLAVAILPLLSNWRLEDRRRAADRDAARIVARALLQSAPPNAVLFVAGDNDSYPLWYLQQVEGKRPDVTLVTLSLLPAEWYGAEVARRTGLRWNPDEAVPGVQWRHQQLAVLIGAASRRAGRPVAASPQVEASGRALLGGRWEARGFVYESRSARDGSASVSAGDAAAAWRWLATIPEIPEDATPVDGVSGSMLRLLDCPRLDLVSGVGSAMSASRRASLESTCNRL